MSSLEAPGPSGDWTMRGTLTQGDLASWILAGSYVRHQPASHAYEAGVSYSMQRYLGGNGEALAAMRDGSRNVGAMYAMDNWTITPALQFSYGAKYARYDYLEDRGLISPRATMILQPDSHDTLKVRTTVMHREVAPGAEEFIPPSVGLWLPPERTFSQVSRASFRPERHDQIEIAVDREWDRSRDRRLPCFYRAGRGSGRDDLRTSRRQRLPPRSVTIKSVRPVTSPRTGGA